AEDERQALAAFVARQLDESAQALAAERWEQALEIAGRLRARAGDIPELAGILDRAKRGIEVRTKRADAARLTARARDALRAARFEDATGLVRQAQAVTPDAAELDALSREIESAWAVDRERRAREAEAARLEAESRARAEQEARRRAEEEARL